MKDPLGRRFSVEMDFLLNCVRTESDRLTATPTAQLRQMEPDWEQFYLLAQQNGLLPLLYNNLKAIEDIHLPETIWNRLHAAYRANGWRNLVQTGELFQLLQLFADEGIRAVPLKGPILAMTLYGDVNLRQFQDLDILIAGQDLARAASLLQARGYVQQEHMNGVLQSDNYAHAFFFAERQLVVELHWDILPGYFAMPLQMAHIWPIIDKRLLSGKPVAIIPPEYLLIILCAHGAKHFWQRLVWVADVAQLLQNHVELDWPAVQAVARAFGSLRMVYLGLYLANNLFSAPLPKNVQTVILKDESVLTLARLVENQLGRESEGFAHDLNQYRFHLRLRERPVNKLHHLHHLIRYWMRPTVRDGVETGMTQTTVRFKLRRLLRLLHNYGPALLREIAGSSRQQPVLPAPGQQEQKQ